MGTVVRKCLACGSLDRYRSWKTEDEAIDQGVMEEQGWACPTCARPEFELVAIDDAEDDPGFRLENGEPVSDERFADAFPPFRPPG